MSEVNQTDAVVPEQVGGATQTGLIATEENVPASSAGRSARERDGFVPELGGPSTWTATMAREEDELVADSTRLSEEEWRQTATTNIDASEIDCGNRCIPGLWEGFSLISSAYSRVISRPEEEPLLSERDRAKIAAARIDFFERMARTGNTVVEDAPGLSEDLMTLGLAGEERVTKRLERSLAEEMHAEEKRLESLEQKAKMASTFIDPHDFPHFVDEDRNLPARGSKLLQTAASEPALLDFEVDVLPIGFFPSDMTVMWSTCNFSTPMEPDDGASAETGEPFSPRSPREPADEEVTLARLTNSPQRPGGLANATHMELSQEFVGALGSITISSRNTGVDEQQEQVQEQVNERSSPSADFEGAHFMARRSRSRSRERYRQFSREARRELYTSRLRHQSPSPDRTRRARSHSIDPSNSRSWDPSQIASSSSRQESPGRRALEADGFFSSGSNVRRHQTRRVRYHPRDPSSSQSWDPTQIASTSSRQPESPGRLTLEANGFLSPRPNVRSANAEFLDYCSSKEKVVESE